jgi:hypothetical protein
MTRQTPTLHILYVGAAILFALLFPGLLHDHADAASVVPNIKLNGMDGKLTISSNTTFAANVQLDSGDENGEMAEW